jgi:hypothetical protein
MIGTAFLPLKIRERAVSLREVGPSLALYIRGGGSLQSNCDGSVAVLAQSLRF